VVLAICSMVAGFVGVPRVLGGENRIERFLTPAVQEVENGSSTEMILMADSTGAALMGLLLAYWFYVAKPELPERLTAKAHAMYSIVVNKYYVDELYDAIIVWPIVRGSREFLWKFIDAGVIDGAVNGVGALVRGSAKGLRHMQTGYVRVYAVWILLGGAALVVWFLK